MVNTGLVVGILSRGSMFFCIAKGRMMISVKKYFAMRMASTTSIQITAVQIASYRESLMNEMRKMGASEQELSLVHDATIRNSIINKREPMDVAWAILQ